MIVRPPFPEVIDSSFMAALRSCRRKAFLEYMEHWKFKQRSVHLVAGAAYAAGLEAARMAFYHEGRPADECVALGVQKLFESYGDFECPDDSAKSAVRTAGALEYYFSVWPLEEDLAKPIPLPSGRPAVEFSFTEPIDVKHPETGNPLLYVGRMDSIVGLHGMTLGEDDKTTSSLGPSWSRQWDLRSQFTGYCWGAERAGIPLDGFLVRGLAILKTKFNHEEAITYRTKWQIDRWYEQTMRDLRQLIKCWEEGYYDYNLDHACNEYGGCPFRTVCLSPDPQPILETLYERRKWDPVTRTETPLEVDHA